MIKKYKPLGTVGYCGHSMGVGDLMMGREETLRVVRKDGVDYVGRVEYGSCSHCNAAADKDFEDWVKKESGDDTVL